MTTSHPDTTAAARALAEAAATRERVRGLPVGDVDRRTSLESSVEALTVTWTDEIRTYLRTGHQIIGRTGDPVRALAQQRRKELARLRSMLNPRPGTAPPAPPDVTTEQMNGSIGHARRVVNAIIAEHQAIRQALGNGRLTARKGGRGHYVSTAELNNEARRLLDQLTDERRNLTTQAGRWRLGPVSTYAEQDRRAVTEEALTFTRELIADLVEELRDSATRSTPLTKVERRSGRPRESWPRDRIEATLLDYQRLTGHWPTAAELRKNPTLPHYTQLRRLYGPRFIKRFDQILSVTAN